MKGVIKVTDGSGHTTMPYDTKDEASMEEAEKRFRELRKRHYVAYAIADIHGQRKGAVVKEFAPEEEIPVKEFVDEKALRKGDEDRTVVPKEFLLAVPVQGG